jgi:hypothetical protein
MYEPRDGMGEGGLQYRIANHLIALQRSAYGERQERTPIIHFHPNYHAFCDTHFFLGDGMKRFYFRPRESLALQTGLYVLSHLHVGSSLSV